MVIIVYGFKVTPDYPLYTPLPWGREITYVLMLPAVYLFLSNTATSVPSSAQVLTAHPLSWGCILWSLAHLLSNGAAPGVIVFSTVLLFGVFSIATGNKRGIKSTKDKRPQLLKEIRFLVVAASIYLALVWGHVYISGINIV